MDSRGQIYLDPTEDDKKKKKLIGIPPGDAEKVINMNRADRRKWYREQKKKPIEVGQKKRSAYF